MQRRAEQGYCAQKPDIFARSLRSNMRGSDVIAEPQLTRIPALNKLPSIVLSQASAVLDELLRCGHSLSTVCREAGLRPASIHHIETAERLPLVDFIRLYAHAFRLLEAETSQREGKTLIAKEVVDMMCFCVINSADLRQAIERAAQFTGMVHHQGVELRLFDEGREARLVMNMHRRSASSAATLVSLAAMKMFYQLFSWLIGQRIALSSLELEGPPPLDGGALAVGLGPDAQWNRGVNVMSFPARYLKSPVVRNYAELLSIIDFFPFDIGYAYHSLGNTAEQLSTLLLAALQRSQSPPSCKQVARMLCVSEATLRRQLRAEQTSYTRLRAQCQRQYAEHLLCDPGVPLNAVARRLGYTDERAFRRAFRAWTGKSPSQFRAHWLSIDRGERD